MQTPEATRTLTVRMPESEWQALAALAAHVGVSPATVARVLLGYALAAMQNGDPEIARAVRTSRDG